MHVIVQKFITLYDFNVKITQEWRCQLISLRRTQLIYKIIAISPQFGKKKFYSNFLLKILNERRMHLSK